MVLPGMVTVGLVTVAMAVAVVRQGGCRDRQGRRREYQFLEHRNLLWFDYGAISPAPGAGVNRESATSVTAC
jgi:hypothetical protein